MAEIVTQAKRIVMLLIVEGLVFGKEIQDRAVPRFTQPASGSTVWDFAEPLLSFIQSIWGGVLFFVDLLSFNIPGTPWPVRVGLGVLLYGPIIWDIITLIRGGGGGGGGD